eukprot:Clim_evm6s26 gene=Clim_evmTU6s26
MSGVMLKREQEVEAEVTKEDQMKINRFSRWMNRTNEIKEELENLKKDYDNLEDAQNEIMLATDTDGGIWCHVGESYIGLDEDGATDFVEGEMTKIKAQMDKLTKEDASLQEQMTKLKRELYAKFKETINLEPDE